MRCAVFCLVGLTGLLCQPVTRAAEPPRFEFKDGDRVVLLGDTLIERDQKYGFLETLITAGNPQKVLTFRNLGWSGDTVRGTARAFFGTEADGFNHLKEHVLALKPTVVILGYGMTDSFDGEAGLPRFVSGLNTLLDALAPTKARFVILSPIEHEDLGRPLPDPSAHRKALRPYSAALQRVAAERQAFFVDLLTPTAAMAKSSGRALTDDGIHPTETGYYELAVLVARALRGQAGTWDVAVSADAKAEPLPDSRARAVNPETSGGVLKFVVADEILPAPRPPYALSPAARSVAVKGLSGGSYRLRIDGKSATTATADQWAAGRALSDDPAVTQVERLRAAINAKNLLYFHRWRPQNETYLFGFRKHEQGNNAREVPLFDPLVEEKEHAIARLKKPVNHSYELVRESEVAK